MHTNEHFTDLDGGGGAMQTEPTPRGPHAYAEDTGTGYEVGVGLASGQMGETGELDVMAANATFGDGVNTHGARGEASVASVEIGPGGDLGPVGGSVEALTVEGGAYIGTDEAYIGAEGTLVGGSVAVGNEDNNAEIGLSAGVGLGGTVYYGDTDSDGVNEYGFGTSVGPVSVDVQSEAAGHVVNAAGDAGGAVVGAAEDAGGAVVGAAEDAGGAVVGAAEDAGGAVVGAAEDAGGAVVGAAEDLFDW